VSNQSVSRLPNEFSDLEVWCEAWCLAGTAARNDRRYATPIEEIRAFYEAMLPRAEAALDYLSALQLGELDNRQENLLKRFLSLAEIGPAVEWYGDSKVSDGYDPRAIPLVVEVPENLPQ
jgi:hypothetical protein